MTCPTPVTYDPSKLESISGSNTAHFPILLIAEGFTDRKKFDTACQTLAAAIHSQWWYKKGKGKTNVAIWTYFADSSGSPDHLGLPPGPGPFPPAPPVLFQTAFENVPNTNRLNLGQPQCVWDLVDLIEGPPNYGLTFSMVALVVDYPLPGGRLNSGGRGGIALATTSPDFVAMMLHEMGHGFMLAEEYAADPGQASSDSSYDAANASSYLHTLPWRTLRGKWIVMIFGLRFRIPFIRQPLVTLASEPDCKSSPTHGSYKWNFVGAFEGAAEVHCDVYRPSLNCRMRNYNDPFCIVCEEAILPWIDLSAPDPIQLNS